LVLASLSTNENGLGGDSLTGITVRNLHWKQCFGSGSAWIRMQLVARIQEG
jgi:hypothetical protein